MRSAFDVLMAAARLPSPPAPSRAVTSTKGKGRAHASGSGAAQEDVHTPPTLPAAQPGATSVTPPPRPGKASDGAVSRPVLKRTYGSVARGGGVVAPSAVPAAASAVVRPRPVLRAVNGRLVPPSGAAVARPVVRAAKKRLLVYQGAATGAGAGAGAGAGTAVVAAVVVGGSGDAVVGAGAATTPPFASTTPSTDTSTDSLTDAAPELEQGFLDLGQRDFFTVTCATCGMVYAKGSAEDEARHRRHHNMVLAPVRLRASVTDPDVVTCQLVLRRQIVRVSPGSDRWAKLHTLFTRHVRPELGANSAATSLTPAAAKGMVAFLSVWNSEVTGCVVAECLDATAPCVQYKFGGTPNTDTDTDADTGANVDFNGDGDAGASTPSDSSTTPTAPVRALTSTVVPTDRAARVGVRTLWVHSDRRRQGVAKALVRAVLRHALHGALVPPDECAFSHPTAAGAALAAAVCGPNFLVYTPAK